MLWSDPSEDESPQARQARRMLRRAGWLLAVAAVLGALLLVR
ncbi:hypothetical protein P3T37_006327 [Kitasatospora sp. MAA4]|nr:hypothetical protein [Kitasatospora sp. MAA4]MDH6136896.1 hypothetical protein [Kitasatospora sp. MAA4]